MKAITLTFAALMFFSASSHAATGPAWAWEAGKITNNGSVQIKSTNGTSTYNAVQNPTGAVAKVNQSAVTQPPTVIIQATSAGYSEAIPYLVLGSGSAPAVPSCPAGYTKVFGVSSYGCPGYANNSFPANSPQPPVYNIGGTRWNLVSYYLSNANAYMVAFVPDQGPWSAQSTFAAPINLQQQCFNVNASSIQYFWAAALCTK